MSLQNNRADRTIYDSQTSIFSLNDFVVHNCDTFPRE